CVEEQQTAAVAGAELSSTVGFFGKNIRGGLAFVADTVLIADLLPVSRSEPGFELQLRDWSAEMTNQLLGRLKNKVGTASFAFKVGIPACFSERSMRVCAGTGDPGGCSLTFKAGASSVRIHLDVSTCGDVTLAV